MPPSDDTKNIVSLQTLIQKAKAIHTTNEETLSRIEARKGQDGIVKHQYTLQTKLPASKKQKTEQKNDEDESLFHLVDKKSTKNANDIIAGWKYDGEALKKEKIAIDDFIHREIIAFDDLVRLNDEYGSLLKRYSQLLMDELESREAVKVVLNNMEILQVGIGVIYDELSEEKDSDEMNDTVTSFIDRISKEWEEIQSKMSSTRSNNYSRASKDDARERESDWRPMSSTRFNNYSQVNKDDARKKQSGWRPLSCKHTLRGHTGCHRALCPFVLNDKQYLACASWDDMIELWDLSNNKPIAAIRGLATSVTAMMLYYEKEIPILAIGWQKCIQLWNLSNSTLMRTLLDHTSSIEEWAVYEKYDETERNDKRRVNKRSINYRSSYFRNDNDGKDVKTFIRKKKSFENDGSDVLTSTCKKKSFKKFDHDDFFYALAVYEKGDKIVLIGGSSDSTIKLWNPDTNSTIKTLQGHRNAVWALSVYNYDNKPYLASGSDDCSIKIWSLEDHSLVKTLNQDLGRIWSLLVVNNDLGQILASGGCNGVIQLWSVGDYDCIGVIEAHSGSINAMNVVECDSKTYLVSGSLDKTVRIWDLENRSQVQALSNESSIHSIAAFRKGGGACFATGNIDNYIKVWME